MNWISKEKPGGRKPTEKDKMKDYFRRHRAPYAPSDDPTDTPQTGECQRSSESRTSSRNKETSPHFFSSQPKRSSSVSTRHHLPSIPLADMNLRGLSRTIQEPLVSVSSELVKLEMMKKLFSHRPRAPSPELPSTDTPNNPTDLNSHYAAPVWTTNERTFKGDAPAATSHFDDNFGNFSVENFEDFQSNGSVFLNMETLHERRNDVPLQGLFHQESADSLADGEQPSSTGPSYWDLTKLGRPPHDIH